MTRLGIVATLAMVGISACENDAAKLGRLKQQMAVACRSVFDRDSTEESGRQALDRVKARNQNGARGASIDEMQADLDEVKRGMAAMKVKMDIGAQDREKLGALLKAEYDERTRCELSQRSLNAFMAGR
jgi:hypothetical protein